VFYIEELDKVFVDQMISHGVSVHDREPRAGKTLLMIAAGLGNVEVLDMLLQLGSDINAQADSGFTAFMYALVNRNEENAIFLKEAGADCQISSYRLMPPCFIGVSITEDIIPSPIGEHNFWV
jgi:ankyrin repeat protein